MNETERLILINQFEILQRLNPDESDNYSEKVEVLKEGYEYHYDDLFGELSDPLSKEDSEFVISVLSMFRDITFSKSKLSDEDEIDLKDISTSFKGFDFNDEFESKLGFYARFFVEKLDRFKELVEEASFDSFNSHGQMLGTYKRNLEQYEIVKQSENYTFGNLAVNQIKEILR